MAMNARQIRNLVVSALLCAIGIAIPMFSPIKLVIPPASFTLGSHVATFIAMFISPPVAVAVSLGTTLGFLLGAFPPVIVLRALSHLIFTIVGALILTKTPHILVSIKKSALFSLLIGIIHAVCEVVVVTLFFFGTDMLSEAFYNNGYVMSVLILVGAGTVVHSFVDFAIAIGIWRVLPLQRTSKT